MVIKLVNRRSRPIVTVTGCAAFIKTMAARLLPKKELINSFRYRNRRQLEGNVKLNDNILSSFLRILFQAAATFEEAIKLLK